MDKTPFAGLTRLDPADDFTTDGASFQAINPRIIDRLLEIGAVSHRHDAHSPLANPGPAPSATVDPDNGSIPAGIALSIGYTLVDSDLGETVISDTLEITTEPPLDAPEDAPTAEIDYTGGSLDADVFFYALTVYDGQGGETPVGAWAEVEREPGFASGQVNLSNLEAALVDAPDGAVWRLYRARGGNQFVFLDEGTADTYTDDGSVSADCDRHPPNEPGTTLGGNQIDVVLPSAGLDLTGVTSIRLYASLQGDFTEDCFWDDYDVGEAGDTVTIDSLNFEDERPPDVSLSIRGASKIDPDLELLDWHWKRPVATQTALPSGEQGDVRMVLDEVTLYAASADVATWDQWTSFLPFDFDVTDEIDAAIAALGGFGDFHWYSPVTSSASLGSGAQGAVRVATNEMRVYLASAAVASSPQWTPIAGIWREPVSGSGALTTGRRGDVRLAADTKYLWAASAAAPEAGIAWEQIVPGSATMGFAKHFNSAAYGRPPGYGMVTWEGSVEPTKAIDGDAWIDTT